MLTSHRFHQNWKKGRGKKTFCLQGLKRLQCELKPLVFSTYSWTVSLQTTQTYLYTKCELLLVCQVVRE